MTVRKPPHWPDDVPFRPWRQRFMFVLLGGAALAAVFMLGRCSAPEDHGAAAPAPDSAAGPAAPSEWTCSMHPQVRLPRKGPCPICFMDLIPVVAGGVDPSAPIVVLTARERAALPIETAVIEARELTHSLELSGKVAPDETRIAYVSSYVPGRLDRLFVNYTGILVNKGDHLAEIYSPDLLIAQREYILALERQSWTESGHSLVSAARRKLELAGVSREQIDRLARERVARDHVELFAPQGGWVVQRDGYPGMYVQTGTRLFTLADLTSVWILLDAYEVDLPYLRYGQSVEFESQAFPGRTFRGRVAYLDPTLSEQTRTVKVRVNVANDSLQLRPGMFVRARMNVRLGAAGEVIEDSLAGKWISPMHPEIVKDGPGQCDICGMALVPAESLGFATPGAAPAEAVAVPASSVLRTGMRAVVYLQIKSDDGPRYEGREIELGPRAGDFYLVRHGLRAGDRVVTRAALQLDSAAQIQGRPSMMSAPAEDHAADAHAVSAELLRSRAVAAAAYHGSADPFIDTYLRLCAALSDDDATRSLAVARELPAALEKLQPAGVRSSDVELFNRQRADMKAALPEKSAADLPALRTALPRLTAALERYLRIFGHQRASPIRRQYCPMAFDDRGAAWLAADDEILNPYFGAEMLHCGQVRGLLFRDGSEGRPQ